MMGLSLHNTIAVIEGYIGRKTPFVRTPKFNINKARERWQVNQYIRHSLSWLTYAEGLLAVYFIGGIGLGIFLHEYRMFFLHLMLAVGFGMVFVYSLSHSAATRRS